MSTPALSFTELESAAKSASAVAAPTKTEETKPSTETTTATVEETKPQFTDTDVAAYRQLQDLGITTDNAAEFLEAKKNLEIIAYALNNDPKAFLEELRKSNPQGADRVVEVFSDDWYERKGKYLIDKPNGGSSSTTRSEAVPDPRVESLEREVKALKEKQQLEDTIKFQSQVKTNYEAALDGLSSKLPADLEPNVKEHIRLKAEKLAWQNDAARARINKGDFTDLPKYFAEASRRVTAETKAAAEKERTARTGVESRGTKELPPGTENVTGATEQKPGQDPIWGNISEAEIAGAYKK